MFAGIVTAVGWNIYRIQSEYQSGEAVYDELEQYAPTRPESNLSLVSSQSGEDTSQGDTGNQFGYSSWIRCEGTGISYPVVQSGDIYSTGVITAQAVFFWTAEMHRIFPIRIYGHHMKNGKMSSVLLDYKKQAF